eukprot:TRINITY_DN20812_c0_g1_i2.p2 TRINITY_DN20812_c0_g1~~TRINITY_DN20812_c0_g1_i2.p2  ORF type:complete len:354 (+),score=88.78 TRINITY_DN20812_c0_g1_i2:394-1455(+)
MNKWSDLHAARHLVRTFKGMQVGRKGKGREDVRAMTTKLLNELDTLKASRCEVGCRSVNTVMNLLCRWGQPRMAVRVMKEEKVPPDHLTHLILIKGFGAMKDPDTVRSLMRERERCGLPPDIICYNALLKAHRRPAEEQMRGVLKELLSKNLTPTGITARESLKLCNTSQSARKLYELNFKELLTAEEYNQAVLVTHTASGDVESVRNILKKLKGPPTLINYNILMNAHAEKGDVVACLDLLRKIQQNKVGHPSAVTYSTILKACCVSASAAQTLAETEKITAHAERIFEEALESRITRNQHLYTNLMQLYAKTPKTPNKKRKIELLTYLLRKASLNISQPFKDWMAQAIKKC